MGTNGEEHILDGEGTPPGSTEMIIKAEDGKVIMRFPTPQLWIAFDPANAVQIGKHLIDCAVASGANVTIEVPRRQISEQKRKILVTRAWHIIRSLQEKGREKLFIARAVVDSILSDID